MGYKITQKFSTLNFKHAEINNCESLQYTLKLTANNTYRCKYEAKENKNAHLS